ncbi:redox-sensitive transcriptional activator SoxR [Cellvibrio sp. NN19]|uniref:redox-sensitive transcriptional activator SoxR n=1 Tax=Cellvibrio chitinivorans TaxID=3102792 RepID=UPI002B403223|nr:redox-sensitive transcriptional activator SoxR [Cellvibrio sp. NN19]
MNKSKVRGERELSVGEVAARSGVAVSAIHFYEAKGLIVSVRNAGNQRRYAASVLRYIAIVKVAQRVGIPLSEIESVLGRYQPCVKSSKAQWTVAAKKWRENLDDRIQKLQRLRDDLNTCIGCGCLSLQDCPLRNPDDVLGEQGPGARILERN